MPVMKKQLALLTASLLAGGAAAKPQQPDVIFVLVDDLRWDGLSCMGHPYVKTPNIDRLRDSGALMENAFCTPSICCPSRATFMTGTYASRHGVIDNETSEYNPDITPPLTKYLQEAGYKTAMIGKWHMGHDARPRPFFDHWVSFKGQGKYNDVEVNIDGRKVKWNGYTTDLLTDEAIRFIEEQPKEQPYFCMLSHKAVHEPFKPAPRHKDAFGADQTDIEPESWTDDFENKPDWQRRQRVTDVRWDWRTRDILSETLPDTVPSDPWKTGQKKYIEQYRCLAAVDEGIGRIFQTLENRGTLNNTLFVFTSDNGYFHGEHRRWDKRLAYEESQRIPMIIACPGLIKAGSAVEQLVANVDFAPTVLDYAAIKIPDQMQGKSMRPLLENKTVQWRDSIFYEYWVDLVHSIPTMTAVRTDQYKLITYPELDDIDELYDVQNDPHELNNLAANPELAPIHRNMQTLLAEQKKQVGWRPNVFPKNLPRFRGLENETIEAISKETRLTEQPIQLTETIDPSSWPFRIDIELNAESDGVVATQAGPKYGYKIYIENGQPGITVLCHTWVDSRTTIDAPDSILGKWSTIQAQIDYNRVKFVVDGKLIESRPLPQPFKGDSRSPLIIGAAGPHPVYDAVPNNPLKGTVRRVILQRSFLDTEELPKATLTGAEASLPPAAEKKTIQFGGDAKLIEKRGVDEIIQWNGVTNLKKAFGSAGTLINKGPGAALTTDGITLTSKNITGAPCTTSAGTSLGIAPEGKWGNFKTAESDSWTFSFDQPVELTELLFVGMNDQNDLVEITVDGQTKTVAPDDMNGTQPWSGKWDLKSYAISAAVPANAEITIKAAGTDAQFGLYAAVVETK